MTGWHRIRFLLVALASLVSLSLFGTTSAESATDQDDETLEWLDDYDEAIALARETGRPLWLEFRCAP